MQSDWTEASANGNGQPELSDDEKKAVETRCKYLKALRESGRAYTSKYMGDFHNARGYVIGEKRFPAPDNQAAKQVEKNMSRTVVNKMYATMDHIVSVLTTAEPKILMKTMTPIEEGQRQYLESLLEARLEEMEWQKDMRRAAWDAEIGGLGIIYFCPVTNELTGQKDFEAIVVDPSKVYVNKQATSFRDARYVVYECTMSLAEIRHKWPDEGIKVRPNRTKACNAAEDAEYHVSHEDDELVQLPGNEFIVTKDGQVVDQETTITFAWEKRPETRTLWEEKTNNQPEKGFMCMQCGTNFVADDPMCPTCEENGMQSEGEPVDIPADKQIRQKFIEKVYPFGTCLIGIPEQQIILYDGPNDSLPLKRVFPFARLCCYEPMSDCFYPHGNYHLLKSCSKALDQTMGLIQDHLRYNAHPILEHPSSADAYNTIGNAPGSKASVDDELCGQARFLDGAKFDYQGWGAAMAHLLRFHDEMSSVDEVARGGGPGPESGEAQKLRQTVRGKRLQGKLGRKSECDTDYAAITWELMTKLYDTPRTFAIRGPDNTMNSVTEVIASLPYKDVDVIVTADPDKVETDRLMGQNLGQFITSGAIFDPRLLPFMDDILSGFGVEPARAEVIQRKLSVAQAAMPQPMGGGTASSAGPPTDSQVGEGEPPPNQPPPFEGAMQ